MTLHFIHIGKTGGTSIKRALRDSGCGFWRTNARPGDFTTPYGRIQLHPHTFRLGSVPPEDYAFFCVRDPVDRFLSAFASRLNEGRPRYDYPWKPGERRSFEAFPTPQRLGLALFSEDDEERELAWFAMRRIRHMRPMVGSLGRPWQLRRRLGRIVHIGRQETLSEDWRQLAARLRLPHDAVLPADTVLAHRREPVEAPPLDAAARSAIERWYACDYQLLAYCEHVRAWHGWGPGRPPSGGPERLRFDLERAGGAALLLPALAAPDRHRRARANRPPGRFSRARRPALRQLTP
jgi:hypothetical protein